jgi:hypothetical protein
MPHEIKIGVIFASENFQDIGERIINYVENKINLYLEKVASNRSPPMPKISFKIKNANGDENIHQSHLESLVDEGIRLIIGGFWSDQAEKAANTPLPSSYLLLCPSMSSIDPIFQSTEHIFSLFPPDSYEVNVLACTLKDYGINEIVLLRQNQEWGDEFKESLSEFLDDFTIHDVKYTPYWEFYEFDDEAYEAGEDPWIFHEDRYHEELMNKLAEANTDLSLDGDDKAVVVQSSEELVDFISFSNQYTNLDGKKWFSNENPLTPENIEKIILDNPTEASRYKIYTPMFEPEASQRILELYEEFSNEGIDLVESPFFKACIVDAAWIIIHTILDTYDSRAHTGIEPELIIKYLPDVAKRYYGYSGYCGLDEFGFRKNVDYNIYGFRNDADSIKWELKGVYNGTTDSITWGGFSPPET